MEPTSLPDICAPTASLANKGRLESLLSRLGSDSDRLGALQMLSATAATASGAPSAPLPTSARKKRAASEALLDREGSGSETAGQLNDQMLPQDETALQRAKKMQEKNKRAQARYRARQRCAGLTPDAQAQTCSSIEVLEAAVHVLICWVELRDACRLSFSPMVIPPEAPPVSVPLCVYQQHGQHVPSPQVNVAV